MYKLKAMNATLVSTSIIALYLQAGCTLGTEDCQFLSEMKFQGYVNIREWLGGDVEGNRNQIRTEMDNFVTYCVSSVKLIISVAMRKICTRKLNGENPHHCFEIRIFKIYCVPA